MNVLEQLCFEAGEIAYQCNKPIDACPYRSLTCRTAWQSGWRTSEDQALDGYVPADGVTA